MLERKKRGEEIMIKKSNYIQINCEFFQENFPNYVQI